MKRGHLLSLVLRGFGSSQWRAAQAEHTHNSVDAHNDAVLRILPKHMDIGPSENRLQENCRSARGVAVIRRCLFIKAQSATLALVFLVTTPASNSLADARNPRNSARGSITTAPFGQAGDKAVDLYTLRNRHGMEARITTYGGIVTALTASDRTGHFDDVVLGYADLAGYLKGSPYFGALIGRYGNRIALGRFVLGDTLYRLAINDGPNSLHGGIRGFDKVVWDVNRAIITSEGPQLTLSYISQDREEGYPGTLRVTARYTLTDDNALRLQYTATTDRETVVNLTQHSYFNLQGLERKGDILDHVVMIDAARFTPVDSTLIPTGELRPVTGTPFDFRKPMTIGARIGDSIEQLRFGRGYDHNWVIDGADGTLRLNATVYEPRTGRVLEVLSDQPGLQFYTGNMLDGTIVGKGGWRYTPHGAFCMEPQHFPDSPNHPEFPSTMLTPGQTYHSTIVYRFSSKAAAS